MNHEDYLIEISHKIIGIFGLNFQSNQLKDMERRILAAAKDLKLETDIHHISDWLSKPEFSNLEINTLSAHLTIGETYFFREKPSLDIFIQRILPELIEQRRNKDRRIRIWSAGCSSGEEPYTIAILIKEHFPELADWNIEILATDISPNAIQKALNGEYTEWSFRETTEFIKNKYFTRSGRNWSILPEIKKMVTFSYLNISRNSYPSSLTNTEEIDVIFCRNVMMYFTPEVIKEVSARFKNSLLENGWLITSQVELNDEYFSNFERVNYLNGIFYQKTNILNKQVKNRLDPIPDHIEALAKRYEIKKTEIKKFEHKIEKSRIKAKEQQKSDYTEMELENQFQKGQYQICIENCMHTISNKKINNKIFTLLIKSYANSGNLMESVSDIAKVMGNNSTTPEMYYLYASLLNEKNDIQTTEVMLKRAIYLDHKHVLSHLMLGEIFLKTDKKQLAIKHYGTVIDILDEYSNDDIVPESDGLTAGRIKAFAVSLINNL